VILLSILRKILAICVIRRINDRVRNEIIPITQAAYTEGRSTTELVFTFKLLAEKAITSENYEINLLMLDMSKAFDTIQRGTLFEDLKDVLEKDELYLIHLLLNDVEIAVKLENEIGEFFKSLIGSPQGDAASALFFIIYLAITLKLSKQKLSENNQLLPKHIKDHDYCEKNTQIFTVDQQYADDISWASTQKSILNTIEKVVPEELSKRNLFVNDSKTEKYTIKRNGDESWKDCKLVGSKLGTKEDIANRKKLTNLTFHTVKAIIQDKKTTHSVKKT
jgi:hypothetical protein